MKIGFDAKRAFNNLRGLGNYSRETLRILSTLAPENQYFLFTPRIDPNIEFTCGENAVIQRPKQWNSKLTQSLWRTFSIAKEAERLGLDVYHGLSHELPYSIEKTKVRTVLTMHDMMFVTHPELFTAFDRLMYRKKYLHSCSIADNIITVSEQTKRDLLELTHIDESKVEVVYQGCRPAFYAEVAENQKQNIREKYHLPQVFLLNVAAFEPRKNQLLILKAMALNRFDMAVVFAGRKSDYLNELQQFAERNGLQHRVVWLPDFPDADLPTLYQCASAFVFPSLNEGFGIPIVEALACKLPVIAATGSCLEESGGPHSIYVSPLDENELAERIQQVLDDEVLRQTMTKNSLEYAQRFSDEAICQQLTRIYKKLLS